VCVCSRVSYRCPSCWCERKATRATVAVSTSSTRARLSPRWRHHTSWWRHDLMTSHRGDVTMWRRRRKSVEQDWAWDVRVRLQDSRRAPSLDSDAAWRHHQLFSGRSYGLTYLYYFTARCAAQARYTLRHLLTVSIFLSPYFLLHRALQRGWYCSQQCLFVCVASLSVNCLTVRDIIMKFSGHHHTVERADKFENSYCGVSANRKKTYINIIVFLIICELSLLLITY